MKIFYVQVLLYLVLGIAALQWPLTAHLGYEFALLCAIVASVGSGLMMVLGPWRVDRFVVSWRAAGKNAALSLGLLLLPLGLVVLNTLRLGSCDWLQGVAFFLLLPVVSSLFSSATACACCYFTSNRWRASLAFIGVLLASLALTLLRVLIDIPVFAFNPFFGWFPGPIYDEALAVEGRLILYRILTLVVAAWWLRLGEMRWQVLDRRRIIQAVVLSLIIFFAFLFENQLGFFSSRGFVQQELGGERSAEGLTVYFDSRLKVEEFNPDEFVLDAQYLLRDLKERLQLDTIPTISIYVYRDVRTKKRQMGAGGTFIGDPINRELHILPTKFPDTTLLHELTHVVAASFGLPFLGTAKSAGIMEGLAVAMEGWRGRFSIHQWAKAIVDKGNDDLLLNIMDGMQFYRFPQQQSYLLSGSFIAWLNDRYGVNALKKVYRSGRYKETFGSSIAELAALWRQSLDTIPLSVDERVAMFPAINRRGIFGRRCPHIVANLRQKAAAAFGAGDIAAAEKRLMHAYSLSEDEPRNLVALAYLCEKQQGSTAVTLYGWTKLLVEQNVDVRYGLRLRAILASNHGENLLAARDLMNLWRHFGDLDALMAMNLIETGQAQLAREILQFSGPQQRLNLLVERQEQGVQLAPIARAWILLRQAELNALTLATIENVERAWQGLSGNTLPPLLRERVLLGLGTSLFRHHQPRRALVYFAAVKNQFAAKVWRRRLATVLAAEDVQSPLTTTGPNAPRS